MASTNHQEAHATNASSHANTLAAQRQQQEFIKLLAQHFHHQFYRLANNNNDNDTNRAQFSGTNNDRQQNFSHFQQQQPPAPTPPGTTATGAPFPIPSRSDLNGMNLIANYNEQQHHILHNHILRSHSTNTGANLLGVNSSEPFVDFATSQNILQQACSHNLNDMNLFNALGFSNLTSNQLVFSLQQQSLLHAVAAARQFSPKSQLEFDQQPNNQAHTRKRKCSKDMTNSKDLNDQEDNQRDGKELLKFSIKTILGKSSTDSSSSMLDELTQHDRSMGKPVTDESRFLGEQGGSARFKAECYEKDERHHQSDTPDCDPSVELCNDSSSTDTPIPQSSNSSSIIFNHQTMPSADHRSANYDGTNLVTATGNHSVSRRHQAPQPPPPTAPHSARHHPNQPHPLPFLAGSSAFPWTVAARGKPRRGMMRRAVFSDSQRVGLEKRFQLQKYISKPDRKKLAEKLGLRDSQVKIWFQNRRMKWRNSKERELLSAGGSREQTLPTRNNPNPDLSDVGETIKRLTSTAVDSPSSNNSLSK